MNMNFFKKVVTFFSILWTTIWRRTVRNTKSKFENKSDASELQAGGLSKPDKVKTKVLANQSSRSVDFQRNCQALDCASSVPDVSDQTLKCRSTRSEVWVRTKHLEEVKRTHLEPTVVDISSGKEVGNHEYTCNKPSSDIIENNLEPLVHQIEPIIVAAVLEPIIASRSLSHDDKVSLGYNSLQESRLSYSLKASQSFEQVGEKEKVVGHIKPALEFNNSLPSAPIHRVHQLVSTHPTDLSCIESPEKLTSINELTSEGKEKSESQLCSSKSSLKSISQINEFDERKFMTNEIQSSLDNVMINDGRYLLSLGTELNSDKNFQNTIPSGNKLFLPPREENVIPNLVDLQSETTLSPLVNNSNTASNGIPCSTHNCSKLDNTAFNALTSVSDVEMAENSKCIDMIPDNYSTNYMVRSDSMINFLPLIRNQDNSDLTSSILPPDSKNDEMVCILSKVDAEADFAEEASAVSNYVLEPNCLEEIMCTSTGILKLSDSNCEVVRYYSPDDLIIQEGTSNHDSAILKENEKIEEIQPDFTAPNVFTYEPCDCNDVMENSYTGSEIKGGRIGPQLQSGSLKNVDNINETKGTGEDCAEFNSKNNDVDTSDHLDELSSEMNVRRRENLSLGNEENHFMTYPVTILRNMDDHRLQFDDYSSLLPSGKYTSTLVIDETFSQDFAQQAKLGGDYQTHSHLGSTHRRKLENIRDIHFAEQDFPREMDIVNISNAPAFQEERLSISNVSSNKRIPFVSASMSHIRCRPKWEPQVSFLTGSEEAVAEHFECGDVRYARKNDSINHSEIPDIRSENEIFECTSGSYGIEEIDNELYPFIDSTSYIFKIPEGARRDNHFNPCVGAAPTEKSNSEQHFEGFKYEKMKYNGEKVDDPIFVMHQRDQCWSGLTQSQHPCADVASMRDLSSINEELAINLKDGSYNFEMGREGISVEDEHTQLQLHSQTNSSSWNNCDEILPIENATSYDDPNSIDYHSFDLDIVPSQPTDFLAIDYDPGTECGDHQNNVCDIQNCYEFANYFNEITSPFLNIPFVIPGPIFVPRGTLPPFMYPIEPFNAEFAAQNLNQNNLYQIPLPDWVGYQMDDESARIGLSSENAHTANSNNHLQLLPRDDNSSQGENDITDGYSIPDPYFQFAENSSLHSAKSKADSYSGSLFCDSLRSILSSHNADSDNVISSFSYNSMRCNNPSLVLRSCDYSLSNDSLPSIIVEEYKTVNEDYSAKEKFMNEVNTALNESIMDQSSNKIDQFEGEIDSANSGDKETVLNEKMLSKDSRNEYDSYSQGQNLFSACEDETLDVNELEREIDNYYTLDIATLSERVFQEVEPNESEESIEIVNDFSHEGTFNIEEYTCQKQVSAYQEKKCPYQDLLCDYADEELLFNGQDCYGDEVVNEGILDDEIQVIINCDDETNFDATNVNSEFTELASRGHHFGLTDEKLTEPISTGESSENLTWKEVFNDSSTREYEEESDENTLTARLCDGILEHIIEEVVNRANGKEEVTKILNSDSYEFIEAYKTSEHDSSITFKNTDEVTENTVQSIVGFFNEESIKDNFQFPYVEGTPIARSRNGWEAPNEQNRVDISFIVENILKHQSTLEQNICYECSSENVENVSESGIPLDGDDLVLEPGNYNTPAVLNEAREEQVVKFNANEHLPERDELLQVEQTPRKRRHKRRRKKKGTAVGMNLAPEKGIGVGSKEQEALEDKLDLPEAESMGSAQEVLNNGHPQDEIPGMMLPEADGGECHQHQEGGHGDRRGAIGNNSSSNRKRRNRRKKGDQ